MWAMLGGWLLAVDRVRRHTVRSAMPTLIAYAWIATVVVTIGFTYRRGLPVLLLTGLTFRAAVDVTAAP